SNTRSRPPRREGPPDEGMERFRIAVGHQHEVMPGNIVGAIANEAGIDAKHIGRITIHDDYSTVDLPSDMPKEIFNELKKVWVSGQTLKISRISENNEFSKSDRPAMKKPKNKSKANAKTRDRDTVSEKSETKKPRKKKPRKIKNE
ncbi:MAG: ATP-dependent RNA helicase, partial [SAR86 cluster bacterium]